MPQHTADFILIGASTRAAAYSALRSGLRPVCFDLFGDEDLSRHAHVQRVQHYPQDFVKLLGDRPQLPVAYVGGLENYPEILEEIAQTHTFWGNSASVVRDARDPEKLKEVLKIAQIEVPEVRSSENPPEPNGEWILKPISGSGGRGVVRWAPEHVHSPTLNEPHRFSRFIEGTSYSGAYIAGARPGDVRFIGLTYQLHGEQVAHAEQYQWCGNIGPAALPVEVEHRMRRAGNILKWKLGLVGLFGVDFIITDDNQVFVLEVNPRYPASLDLLEFATGQALFADHVRCFDEDVSSANWEYSSEQHFVGKMVVYAPQLLTCHGELSDQISGYSDFPTFGDIPQPGVVFQPGDPYCTVYARGRSIEGCRMELAQRVEELNARLRSAASQ